MNLIESILTKNDCYKSGKTITPKGLMIHSVGCNQPKASVFVNSWNKPGVEKCVHAFLEPNGDVYQTLPWNHRGWHCASGPKGSGNNTHIGVEMTEPATIRYVGGASWEERADGTNTKAHVLGTYRTAVELFAYLCKLYSLDPLEDGVIISHSEGNKRGIASNHGDVEHIWRKFGLTMEQFRQDIKAAMDGETATTETDENTSGYTAIMGMAQATAEQMSAYLKKVNPNVPDEVLTYPALYLSEGEAEGVRGDIAFAQSLLETGNFTFSGSAVELSQSNFCGMGVTSNGLMGNSFDSPQEGIRAQIQHLKAYACEDELANPLIDPRFQYVKRGSAPYVEWLGQKENPNGYGWATGEGYGSKILAILAKIVETVTETVTDSGVDDTVEIYPERLTSGHYRVRKMWEDKSGQIGAYRILANAKAKADENPGYFVFSEEGKAIYPDVSPDDSAFDDTEGNVDADTEAIPSENDGNTKVIGYAKLKAMMNIRSGANLNADILDAYKKDTVLPILQYCTGGWLRVVYGSGFAYVSNVNGQYAYTGSRVHTVVRGDSLYKLAASYFGDGNRYTEIKAANGMTGNLILVGQTLIIP